MARQVFFSFDYDQDVRRVEQVRNCGALDPQGEAIRFFDAANRETLKRQGDAAITKWINEQMHGTSVTVVLFGARTHLSEWVNYEIKQSVEKGNGLLGIDIHGIKDPLLVRHGHEGYSVPGCNPLDNVLVLDKDYPYGALKPVYSSDQFTVTRPVTNAEYAAASPATRAQWDQNGRQAFPISRFYSTYDWVLNDGRGNIATWIEEAAQKANR